MIEYKGYIGHVEFDDEADIFHGEVINTRDVITFQGKSVSELRKALKGSVDEYLAFCKKKNRAPEKPFSGKFMLRVPPELHRELFIAAKTKGLSLNKFVTDLLGETLHAV